MVIRSSEVVFRVARWGPLAALMLQSCSSPSRVTVLHDGDASVPVPLVGDACVDDVTTAPPGPDADGLCGNTFLNAVGDPPNIYFVIDRSGSMSELVDGQVKYAAVVRSAVGLVRSVGSQANIGAAVFPAPDATELDPCKTGIEVFKTR